jgi:hypothetical protein
VNSINQNLAGTPVDTADGNGRPTGPAPEERWPSQQITSSAWEGWWWGDPLEEPATDPEARG